MTPNGDGSVVNWRRRPSSTAAHDELLFFVGEERLLAVDLVAAGWRLAYVRDVVAHHPLPPEATTQPSADWHFGTSSCCRCSAGRSTSSHAKSSTYCPSPAATR